MVGALDDNHSPGIFAVEQPELHVHPTVQVALGDVFIDSKKSSGYSYFTMEEFLNRSPAVQEALDKFHPLMENSKKELLDNIKNINEPAIETILDTIIDMIQDKNPLEVEVLLDMIICMIKDKAPPDVQLKKLFQIKEKYDYNIQVATKEFIKKYVKGVLDNAADSNRTMLIETHSEHLLLRLLRRVHETSSTRVKTNHKLTPDDLSVVYVRPTPAGVKFIPLTVTDDGDFGEPWPEGFFEERDSELFYHA